MKKFVFVLFFLVILFPVKASALVCSKDGYTIVYINGILTTKDDADTDKQHLESKFEQGPTPPNVRFISGYNQTHLAGLGDWIKSVEQAYQTNTASYINDYDLNTILMQIHPEVTTRRILLVGHSQGTFYTNALYDYLITHGVPKESIAVYNLATPASFVSGGGKYLTSINDSLVQAVLAAAIEFHAQEPLPANISIPLQPNEPDNLYRGHSVSGDYLAGAPDRIVSDMDTALGALVATSTFDAPDGCFTPPGDDLGYKAQQVAFSAADPLTKTGYAGAQVAYNTASTAAVAAAGLARTGLSLVANTFLAVNGTLNKTAAVVLPKNTPKTSQGGFGVVSALYGSSLSNQDVAELLADDYPTPAPSDSVPSSTAPVPEVQNAMPPAPAVPSSTPEPPTPSATYAVPIPTPPPVSAAGFGGGGAPANTSPPVQAQAQTPTPTIPAALAILSPADNALFATTSVTFTGTTSPNGFVDVTSGALESSTTADGAGNWSLRFVLPEGANMISFAAFNATAGATTTVNETVTVDTIPPGAPVPAIAECAYSLATTTCLLGGSAATLTWSGPSDAASFAIYKNGAFVSSTTASSTSVTLNASATSTFLVVANDAAGNAATSTSVSAYYFPQPLVINEIAWAGTTASATDQWIEFKNRTSYTLDLSHAAVYAADGSVYVPLAGLYAIPPAQNTNRLLTVEAMSGAVPTSTFVLAQPTVKAFSLSSGGNELGLGYWNGSSTTTLDRTPAVVTCGGWCAGSSTGAVTMERVSASNDGTRAASWQNNDEYTQYGTDRNGNAIHGTPTLDNSLGLPSAGWYCGNDTFAASGGSYLPSSHSCTYLSNAVGGNNFGAIFVGTVGSSTEAMGHLLNSNLSTQADTLPGTLHSGDTYFVALFTIRNFTPDLSNFTSYFTTGSPAPPTTNYRVIQYTVP